MRFHLVRAALTSLLVTTTAIAEPTVKLDKGHITYHGTTSASGSIEHFHNIKYGHDTSGARRFAPPEPYIAPEGSVLDASAPGPACPQLQNAIPPLFAEVPKISEDCLNLRLARPTGTSPGDKLPVVVHIYTGGLIRGNAHDPHWEPESLLTLSTALGKPVIYVALNFRLTIFGYARLPLLKDQKSLNVGMRDQRVGIEWVKENIAAFGGDPERITVFGLSAGGTMTSLQLMAYGGEYGVPFTQAWMMSGPPGTAVNATSYATELHTRAVAERLDCPSGDDEQVLKCLREVPMDRLTEIAMEYSANNHPPMGLFTFIPSVDGDILPDRQSLLYKSGQFAKDIPLVLGWTQDDGATNAGPASAIPDEASIQNPMLGFFHGLTDEDYRQLFDLYPASDFEQEVANYEATKIDSDPDAPVHWFRASRILRDMLFTCSSIDFGYEMHKQSRALNPDFPGVRLYNLNQSMMTPMFKAMGMPYIAGAPHGSDYNYISNGVFLDGEVTDDDKSLAEALSAAFLNFAYSGDPSSPDGKGLGHWPDAFSATGGFRDEKLSAVEIQLIGGPLGSGPAKIRAATRDSAEFEDRAQIPLEEINVGFGEMDSAALSIRNQEIRRQRLLERCAFIEKLAERLDI